MDKEERRIKYLEIKNRYNKINSKFLYPLYDAVFDKIPLEYPSGDLFYIISTKQTGFRCSKCNKVRLISYKHASRDIWKPIVERKENVCVNCNRSIQWHKGWDKIQKLQIGTDDESLKFQENHKKQWHECSIAGGKTVARFFDENDELYNTPNAIAFRKNFYGMKRGGFKPIPREILYKDSISIIIFNNLNKEICLNDIDNFKNIPGVWSIWKNDKCFDVYQSKNIGNEMLLFLRRINRVLNNEDSIKSKQWFNKYKLMEEDNKDVKFTLKLVSINIINVDEREKIEIQYAHDNKALYWNPAPNQMIYIKNLN